MTRPHLRALPGWLAPVPAAAASLAVVLLAWTLFLHAFSVSPLIGKSPQAVWHYLFLSSVSARNRDALLAALSVTLLHAGIGFAAGYALGLGAALGFVLAPAAEAALMPLLLVLRAMPLVALTPLIVLLCGRGLPAIALIGALVVFLPTVVVVTQGLRAAPAALVDLIRAQGGGDRAVLRRARLPFAVPSLLAAAQMSVPASLVGALLAEWLASGDGLGNRMQRDISGFRSSDLWSGIVILTVCALLSYAVLGVLQRLAQARFGGGPRG